MGHCARILSQFIHLCNVYERTLLALYLKGKVTSFTDDFVTLTYRLIVCIQSVHVYLKQFLMWKNLPVTHYTYVLFCRVFFIVCVLLHFKDGIAFSFAILLKPTREHFNVGKHRDICFYLIYENEN